MNGHLNSKWKLNYNKSLRKGKTRCYSIGSLRNFIFIFLVSADRYLLYNLPCKFWDVSIIFLLVKHLDYNRNLLYISCSFTKKKVRVCRFSRGSLKFKIYCVKFVARWHFHPLVLLSPRIPQFFSVVELHYLFIYLLLIILLFYFLQEIFIVISEKLKG